MAHWDYAADMLEGWDYDVGAHRVREEEVEGEAALSALIDRWGLKAGVFRYAWDTADPR
ncbi:hypothetical protein [Actinoplanes sp. NPDC048796]|uniref:hypothetical protein n=1 Tax=Actinoplanes sp. NPDC048796 TaxID=3155640 RepID=UPI0033FFDBC8